MDANPREWMGSTIRGLVPGGHGFATDRDRHELDWRVFAFIRGYGFRLEAR